MKDFFQFIPLGGVGEIGHNMALIKTPSQHILIDAGILFPDYDFFGLSYLIPNLDEIDLSLITDIVITHGHEDHIGAIKHLLQPERKLNPDLKIWAPAFAAICLKRKLENSKTNLPLLHIYNENSVLHFSDLIIHPIHVNHSIPDTYGLLIQDPAQTLSFFYVSDFKVDEHGPYEAPFNFEKLKKLSAHSSLKFLLADSTNILNPGKTPSEGDLIPQLKKIIQEAPGRVLATFFPSNTFRMQTFLNIAGELDKKIVLIGRGMKIYKECADSLGYLNYPSTLFKEEDSLTGEEENIIYLLSGCQGDLRSGLRNVVYGEHSKIKLKESDLVIFSSKVIPGNEIKIINIYNKIAEQGANIISPEDLLIHASGHASQQDLKKLFEKYCPTHFTPIHGETFFLNRHLEFAQKFFPQVKTIKLRNFDEISIQQNGQNDQSLEIKIISHKVKEPIFILEGGVPIDKKALQMRKKISSEGLILFSCTIDEKNQSLENLRSEFLGLPLHLQEHQSKLHTFLTTYHNLHLSRKPNSLKEEELRVQIRRYFQSFSGLRPRAIVHLHTLWPSLKFQ